ncbi:MAG: DUF3427 domain-containing protein [Planctomycetota bacterium]
MTVIVKSILALMFKIGRPYSKNEIYDLLQVPLERRKGEWDTGYRVYEGDIFIFANVGIPGRTGHDYNNFWDGEYFIWEAKSRSNINQPLIRKMLTPEFSQKNHLFTRIKDKAPFTYEGTVLVKEYKNTTPVQITWELNEPGFFAQEVMPPQANKNTIFYEGSVRQVVVNKYERNTLARRLCIEHYGAICRVCGFDFHKTYGELGEGFIHVHHLVPLFEINQEYILDPIKDLIPICPNCHSMIHRKKVTLSLAELKAIINRNLA